MAVHGKSHQDPRAKIRWPVEFKTPQGSSEGVTLDLGTEGAFVSCAKPLKLNEVFDMVISAPNHSIKTRAEVVWSNIHGPDDEITPRGMGVRFLSISSEHRRLIANMILASPESQNLDPEDLKALKTILIEPDELL